jgi:hypothetical protein
MRKLSNLCPPPSIIKIIKWRGIKWAGHVARMGEKINACMFLVGNPEAKRLRRRWVNNIKIDLREIDWRDHLSGLLVRVPDYRSRRPGLDARRYHIFWDVVGLQRGPLSLVSTIEKLLGRKNNGSCLESREYGRRVPSRWPPGNLYPQNLALASPTNGSRSVGRIRSRTQVMEFSFRDRMGYYELDWPGSG